MTPARSVIAVYCSGRRCAAKLNILSLPWRQRSRSRSATMISSASVLRFGDDPAVGIHDAGAADQSGAILVPGLGDRDRPGGVHVGVGLSNQLGMEGAQRRVFGDAAVRIVGRGIVADANQLDALQAQHAPAFRPAAIIADHHAHDRVAPVRPRAKGRKSQIAIFEIALFELLVALRRHAARPSPANAPCDSAREFRRRDRPGSNS